MEGIWEIIFVRVNQNQIYTITNKLGELVLNPLENNNTNKF